MTSLFARLFRLVWGADVDRALRPVLAVSLASSMGGSTVWSFVGIWAIRHLHARQSTVGVVFLISAMVGVLAGYAGGHLSDHVGRRPLILVSWACQVVLVLGFLAALRSRPRHGDSAPEEPPTRHSFGVIVRDRPFLLFLVSSALAWLVYVSFEVVLPISLVQAHGLAPATWGFLVVVNPIVVTLFQLRLTRLLRPVPAALKLAVALPLMGFPFVLLRVVDAVPAVALMILVFVVGEMLWVPTSQTIVAGLAPEDVRGAYMGAFGSMAAIGFALGPFLGLQLRATYGDAAVWAAVAALSLVAAVIGAAACRIAIARRPRPASAAA